MNPQFQVADDGIKWNVDNIHNKYLISVLHLLVALARHYGIPRRLPSFVKIQVLQITVSYLCEVLPHTSSLRLSPLQLADIICIKLSQNIHSGSKRKLFQTEAEYKFELCEKS